MNEMDHLWNAVMKELVMTLPKGKEKFQQNNDDFINQGMSI
jgi:hypothetical protein